VVIERSDFGTLSADIMISQDMSSLGLGTIPIETLQVITDHINPKVQSQDLMFSQTECSFFGIQFKLFVCLHLTLSLSASSCTLVSISYALEPVRGELATLLSVEFVLPSDSVDGNLIAGCQIAYGTLLRLCSDGLKAVFCWENTVVRSETSVQFPTSRFLCVDFGAPMNPVPEVSFFTASPVPTCAHFTGMNSRQLFVRPHGPMSLPSDLQISMREFREMCRPATPETADIALYVAILASNQSNHLQLGNVLTWHSFEIGRVDVTFLDNVIKSFSFAFSSEFKDLFCFWYKDGRCSEAHMQITIYSMSFWYEKFKFVFNHCRSELAHISDRCIKFQMQMQEMQKLTGFADVTGYLEYLRTGYGIIPPDAHFVEHESPLDDLELSQLELRWLRNVDIKRLIELSEPQKRLATMLPRLSYDGKFIATIWDETAGRDPRKDAFLACCSAGIDQANVVSFFNGLVTRRDRREKSVIKYILESHYNLRDIEKIGRGGEATVFKCRHADSNINQAAKVFAFATESSCETERDPQFYHKDNRKRIREARKIQRCKHSGIVKINDVFCSGDPVVILMEFLPGLPLKDFMEKWVGGDLPSNLRSPDAPKYVENAAMYLNVVLDIVRQICGTVSYLHRNGIIHADLSFGNVMVVRQEGHRYPWSTKIIDFGLAKDVNCLSEISSTVTANAANRGTAFFMSPERRNNHGRKKCDDVWSLGVIVFMIIFQHPPATFSTSGNCWHLDYQNCFRLDGANVSNVIDTRVKLRKAAKNLCFSRNDSRFMFFYEICVRVFYEVNPNHSDLHSTNDLILPICRLIDVDCFMLVLQKAASQSVYDVCLLADDDSRSLFVDEIKKRLERQKIGNRSIRCVVLSLAEGIEFNSVAMLDSLIFVPVMTIPECLQNDAFIALLQLACNFCKKPSADVLTPRFRGAVRLRRIVPVLYGFDQVASLKSRIQSWHPEQRSKDTLDDLIGTWRHRDTHGGTEPKLIISDEYADELKQSTNVFQILREHAPDATLEELVVVPDVDSGRHRLMRISTVISSHVMGFWNELMGFHDVAADMSQEEAQCQEFSVRSEALRLNVALWFGRFHFIILMVCYYWTVHVFFTENLGLLSCIWGFNGTSLASADSNFTYRFTFLVNTSTNLMVQERRNFNDSSFYVQSRQTWLMSTSPDDGDAPNNHFKYDGLVRYKRAACQRPQNLDFLEFCVSLDDIGVYSDFLSWDRFDQLYSIAYEFPQVNCSLSPLVQSFYNVTDFLCPVHSALGNSFFIRGIVAIASIVIFVYKQRSSRFEFSENKKNMINSCGVFSVRVQAILCCCGLVNFLYLIHLVNAIKSIQPAVPVWVELEAPWFWIMFEFIASFGFTIICMIFKDFLARLESKESMKNCIVTKLCRVLGIQCMSPNDGFDFEMHERASQGGMQWFFDNIRRLCCCGFVANHYVQLRSESGEIELQVSNAQV